MVETYILLQAGYRMKALARMVDRIVKPETMILVRELVRRRAHEIGRSSLEDIVARAEREGMEIRWISKGTLSLRMNLLMFSSESYMPIVVFGCENP